MPTYRYRGVTQAGAAAKGAVEADTVSSARRKLRAEGVFPASIEERADGALRRPVFSGLGGGDVLPLVTRQLSTLVGAGVPLVGALRSIALQVDEPGMRKALGEIREAVQGGSPLGQALEAHPGTFPELYASMVKAGEESGTLPGALSRLADHLESQAKTRNRVRAALAYPVLMAVTAAVVVVVLLTVVVPKIVGVFAHLGKALPLPTRALIAVSGFLAAWWWLLLALAAAAVLAARRRLATEAGKRLRDRIALRLPVAGRLVHLSALSRFARTLATLAAGGIPIDRALKVVAPVVGNRVIAEQVGAAAARVVEGVALSEALRAHAGIPPTLVQMVAAGEESGRLDFLLDKMADALDAEIEARLTRLLSLLEPLIILSMGLLVAFIVVSVMLPLLDISRIVR